MILFLFSLMSLINAAPPQTAGVYPYEGRFLTGKQGDPILHAFPTPQGAVDLTWSPIQVTASQPALYVQSAAKSEALTIPNHAYYRAVGKQGELLFLSRRGDQHYRGFLRDRRQTWLVQWRDGHVVYQTADAGMFACDDVVAPALASPDVGKTDTTRVAKKDGRTVIDLAVETDIALYRNFGQDADLVLEGVLENLAAVNAVFATDLNVEIRLTYLRVYTDSTPWGNGLPAFRRHWLEPANGKFLVQRHIAFQLLGRGSSGSAYTGGVGNRNWGYGRVPMTGGLFSDTLILGDTNLIGHEIGHSLGARHTHDFNPPIDRCASLRGDIPAGGGTIMSYCNFQTGGSLQPRFHPQNSAHIAATLAAGDTFYGREDALIFPDPVLKQVLLSTYDGNQDGKLTHAEAEQVLRLDISGSGVVDLSGIHLLVNLVELQAPNNAIQQLPWWLPPNLATLNLANNPLAPDNCDRISFYKAHPFNELVLTPIGNGGFLPCDTRYVTFADPALHQAVLAAADTNEDGRISQSEARGLTSFSAVGQEIRDITGIDQLVNLRYLDLSNNEIRELPPLPANLTILTMTDNLIEDISATTSLRMISDLVFTQNHIQSLPDFDDMPFFSELYVAQNRLRALPDLRQKTFRLTILDAADNQIETIGGLPELLFHVNLNGNALREIPEIPANDYFQAQEIDLRNNPFIPSATNCARLAELAERNTRSTLLDTDRMITECSGNAMPPLRYHFPWIVKNARFQSTVSLRNDQSIETEVVLRAVSAQGEQSAAWVLQPGERRDLDINTLFPTLDRFSLGLYSYGDQVTMASEVVNLAGPSAGARAAVRADWYKRLPNKQMFPGLNRHSALALSAPDGEGPSTVTLTARDAAGTLLGTQDIGLSGAAPEAVLISDLWPDLDAAAELTVRARIDEGKRLSANSFRFEGWAEMGMARGLMVYGQPSAGLLPLGTDRNLVVNLHNGTPTPVSVFGIASNADNPSGVRKLWTVTPYSTLRLTASELTDLPGDVSVFFSATDAIFVSVTFFDDVGSGARAPAFTALPVLFDMIDNAQFDLSATTTAATLYLTGFYRGQTLDVTAHLSDENGGEVASETITLQGTEGLDVALTTLFPGVDLGSKTLTLTSAPGTLLSTLLRSYNADGRSSVIAQGNW